MLQSQLQPHTRVIEVDDVLIGRYDRPGQYGRGAAAFHAIHAGTPLVEATRRADAGPATVEAHVTRLMLPESARAVLATLRAATEFAERSIPTERLEVILGALNRRPLDLGDVWRSAHHFIAEVDPIETDAADELGLHDVLVLIDGTRIGYDYDAHGWRVG